MAELSSGNLPAYVYPALEVEVPAVKVCKGFRISLRTSTIQQHLSCLLFSVRFSQILFSVFGNIADIKYKFLSVGSQLLDP